MGRQSQNISNRLKKSGCELFCKKVTKGCSQTSAIIFTFTENQHVKIGTKSRVYEKSRTNYQLSHVRTNNQQSDV